MYREQPRTEVVCVVAEEPSEKESSSSGDATLWAGVQQ